MNRAIFLALVIGLVCSQPDFELDEGVIILTEDNFDDVVNHFDYVLVMFYAPWCGHCKKLKPEYKAAATALADKGSEMRIGMVDATEHTALGSRFEVQGYPTLKFFIGGDAIEYNGPREKDGILNWLRKKTEPSTTPLGDSESVEKAKTDNEAVGVFFGGEDSEEFGLWKKITQSFDDMVFHHILDADLAAEYGVEGVGVVLFKQFDEGRNDFEGEFTVDAVKKFVEDNSVPTIMKFDDKAAKLIFGGGKDCLFVFADDSDASAKALDALQEVKEKLKGQILMSRSGIVDGLDKRLADYIGVTDPLPQVWIVDPSGGDISKYSMEGDISGEAIVKFFEDYQGGNINTYVKSEPVPESQDQPVFQIVGLNWEDVVMDKTKDVLVKYYAPWCGHCKAMAPIYADVATALSSEPNLIIAEMDATANEVDGVSIQGFPTLKFYPANNKTPMDFSGDRTAEGFYQFLEKSTSKVVKFDFATVLGGADEEEEEEEEEATEEAAEEDAADEESSDDDEDVKEDL